MSNNQMQHSELQEAFQRVRERRNKCLSSFPRTIDPSSPNASFPTYSDDFVPITFDLAKTTNPRSQGALNTSYPSLFSITELYTASLVFWILDQDRLQPSESELSDPNNITALKSIDEIIFGTSLLGIKSDKTRQAMSSFLLDGLIAIAAEGTRAEMSYHEVLTMILQRTRAVDKFPSQGQAVRSMNMDSIRAVRTSLRKAAEEIEERSAAMERSQPESSKRRKGSLEGSASTPKRVQMSDTKDVAVANSYKAELTEESKLRLSADGAVLTVKEEYCKEEGREYKPQIKKIKDEDEV